VVVLQGVDKSDSEGTSFNAEAGATQLRLAASDYGDGESTPAGSERKSAREISNIVAKQESNTRNARQLSEMVWAWGQFIDHDIVDTVGGSEQFNIDLPVENEWRNEMVGELDEGDFTFAIKDYYLTNPIARASTLMSELSAQTKARKSSRIAAE